MCGIAGKVGQGRISEAEVLRMCDAIAHRGPDDWGTFVEGNVGLGMRRLSMVDVAGGHQPMSNEDGSVVVVFNGEIYTFPSLYEELVAKGHRFRTRSDTEALVHLYEEHGEKMVARLRGMFAFAIWDRNKRRLLIARDHFGQKPLFYTEQGGALTFASEIKALLADDPSLAELSPRALDQYLTMRFVQPPETFFARVRALPPAHYMVWENGHARIERYWSLTYGPKWTYSEAETLDRIDELLAETVKLHLLSDVPVGAFLSGGLDSTLIASYAAKTLGTELRTFSMGIPYRDLNELPYAAAVAARYGTQHYAEEVTPSVVEDLPRLVSALDEPADPLSICLLHLARMTARHVKVVLGGDGGDELFGGYDRYAADRWLDTYRAVPEVVRNAVSTQLLKRLPDQFTFKSFTHKLRWVDLMARKTGGERYAESMQYFWFNDPRRAELMARVPSGLKIRGRRLRYLERRLGERYLPPEVLQRKKQGFASPLMYILEGEVRELAPRLLRGSELVRAGYLRAERMRQIVKEHLTRQYDHGNRIWLLLTAEVWYRRYISRRSQSDLEMELSERMGEQAPAALAQSGL